jgi:hypothetical protein
MLTAIFILQCVLVLLFFSNNKNSKSTTNNDLQINQQGNPNSIDIFRQGLQQSWMHVNVSLYKMWNELEILDFQSLQTKLQQTLESLTKDPAEMTKWAEKFKEYLKEQEKQE